MGGKRCKGAIPSAFLNLAPLIELIVGTKP